jgi:TolB-like protein
MKRKSKKWFITTLYTILIFSTQNWNLYAQNKYIAVVEFEGNGISSNETKALTNRLRNELHNVGLYEVYERGLMDEILKEQGFQQTGCVSDECLVNVGKLIGVDQIVGGSISKVGNTLTVSARLIEVETGKLLKVTDYDYNGPIDGLLTSGMHVVAIAISKKDTTDVEKIASGKQPVSDQRTSFFKSPYFIPTFVGILATATLIYVSKQDKEKDKDNDDD